MPTTIIPAEPEEAVEAAKRVANEAIAGTSVTRTVVLYVLIGLALVSPVAPLGVIPLILLLATDHDLV